MERLTSEKTFYYARQYIDNSDIKAVTDVMKSDYLTCGPKTIELEKKLSELTKSKYAAAVSSGTAALHAACNAAGISDGDEVITTPITFAATANSILYCGGRPVFADINPETYNISPQSIREHITDKTKAVIAVDFTGQAAELDEICEICRNHKLLLIEDAAHAIGTKYNSLPVGNIADMTIFSFHAVKTVTGAEGGAVVTNNDSFYEKIIKFRTHGITRDIPQISYEPWFYQQNELGYNYRLNDIQAALIISQLSKLGLFIKRRKEIVNKYNEAFSYVPEIILQKEIPQSDTSRHLYVLRLDLSKLKADRRQIYEALKEENIICNVHYIPVYFHDYYKKLGYHKGLCPQAEKFYEEILTIPLYYSLTDDDVAYIIKSVKKVIELYKK